MVPITGRARQGSGPSVIQMSSVKMVKGLVLGTGQLQLRTLKEKLFLSLKRTLVKPTFLSSLSAVSLLKSSNLGEGSLDKGFILS